MLLLKMLVILFINVKIIIEVMEVHMRFANLKSQKNIQILIQKNISIEVNIYQKGNVPMKNVKKNVRKKLLMMKKLWMKNGQRKKNI